MECATQATRITRSRERHPAPWTLADTGRAAAWWAPKLTAAGDTVLFYVIDPVSAIVAVGEAVSGTKATSQKWYEVKVGKVRLLDSPITLVELREMFPDWAWLRSANMFAYVTPKRAEALLRRCQSAAVTTELARCTGGGFGDAETNALVEQAAVRKVIRLLKRRGFKVCSRESERIGYDLDATKGRTELHVEVKGVSGDVIQFPITRKEVAMAGSDTSFWLMVVTGARNRQARVHEFRGRDVKRRFALEPLSYLAAKR
jgi:predicted transcriptional regulator